jgi:hypothetical protein
MHATHRLQRDSVLGGPLCAVAQATLLQVPDGSAQLLQLLRGARHVLHRWTHSGGGSSGTGEDSGAQSTAHTGTTRASTRTTARINGGAFTVATIGVAYGRGTQFAAGEGSVCDLSLWWW